MFPDKKAQTMLLTPAIAMPKLHCIYITQTRYTAISFPLMFHIGKARRGFRNYL